MMPRTLVTVQTTLATGAGMTGTGGAPGAGLVPEGEGAAAVLLGAGALLLDRPPELPEPEPAPVWLPFAGFDAAGLLRPAAGAEPFLPAVLAACP
jgi:hypothetical protein